MGRLGVVGMTVFVTQKQLADAVAGAASAPWPVGSIFTSVVATNPATLLGFGTWAAFGAGRVLVGLNAGDPDFDTVEETGGAKTHTHDAGTLVPSAHAGAAVGDHASHTHTFTPAGTINAHTTTTDGTSTGGTAKVTGPGTHTFTGTGGTTAGPSATLSHSVTQPSAHTMSGTSAAANGLPPYIVVYMWERTA
jgi:hypothetical protein